MGVDHGGHGGAAGLAGGDLGLEVADVAFRRAAGPQACGQGGARRRFEKLAAPHDRQGVQHHPFLVDSGREWRHGAGLDSAHVGMMPARRHEEGGRLAASVEHRHDHGYVGQMRAPGVGVVGARRRRRKPGWAGCRAFTARTLAPMEPRCTGMCGALATSPPPASNRAQEKSSRSLILTERAVRSSAAPMASATPMNRQLKSSSVLLPMRHLKPGAHRRRHA